MPTTMVSAPLDRMVIAIERRDRATIESMTSSANIDDHCAEQMPPTHSERSSLSARTCASVKSD